MLFKVKARYWPNNDMGDSPAEDLVKIKDILRWESSKHSHQGGKFGALIFFLVSFSYFLSPLDTDSQLLLEAGLPVFSILLKQPTAFSLATLFTIGLPKVVQLFVKNVFGLGTPNPLGKSEKWTCTG